MLVNCWFPSAITLIPSTTFCSTLARVSVAGFALSPLTNGARSEALEPSDAGQRPDENVIALRQVGDLPRTGTAKP